MEKELIINKARTGKGEYECPYCENGKNQGLIEVIFDGDQSRYEKCPLCNGSGIISVTVQNGFCGDNDQYASFGDNEDFTEISRYNNQPVFLLYYEREEFIIFLDGEKPIRDKSTVRKHIYI